MEHTTELLNDKQLECIVFHDTGLGNYGAAMMAYRIPNVEEPQELQAQQSSRFNISIPDDEQEAGDKAASEAPSPTPETTTGSEADKKPEE